MLNQQTLEKLHALRLHGMAEAFRAQSEQTGITELSFEERFALLVDQQWNWRQNRALAHRLSKAKLRHRASVEDLDFRSPRGLDRTLVRSLTQDFSLIAGASEDIFLLGPTGIGKSFLACALAEKACRDGFTAFYTRAPQLFRDLALARADGSLRFLLARLARLEVLVVDDWAMAPLADTERRDFLEICEDRYQRRSMILTSQLPVANWHEQIGDPTLADSILDRLVHNAHRIELQGESMRKETRRQEMNNVAALRTPRAGAVEMPPHGKRGSRQVGTHPFHRAWKSGKGRPDSHISTAPAAGLFKKGDQKR